MTNNLIVNDRLIDPEKNKKLTEQVMVLRKCRGGNADGGKEKKKEEERDK